MVSLDRGINTKIKNIKILLGTTLLKKLDDEAPKKVKESKRDNFFLAYFSILLVKHNYSGTSISVK